MTGFGARVPVKKNAVKEILKHKCNRPEKSVCVDSPAFYLYCGLKVLSALLILLINLEFKKAAKSVISDFIQIMKNEEVLCLLASCFVLGTSPQAPRPATAVPDAFVCFRFCLGLYRKLPFLAPGRPRRKQISHGHHRHRRGIDRNSSPHPLRPDYQ